MYVKRFNQRLDWSVVDLALINRHFTEHPALSFSICGSFSHSPDLCPNSVAIGRPSEPFPSPQPGEPRVMPPTPLCITIKVNVFKSPSIHLLPLIWGRVGVIAAYLSGFVICS